MRTKLTLLFSLLAVVVFAQPTLTSSKMLAFGSSFNMKYFTDLSGVDTTIQGANKTWDFTGLQSINGDDNLITIENPQQTPNATSFTTSNYCYYGSVGTYDYYALNSTNLQRTGSWDANNGIITYSDPQIEMKFPETLGTTSNDTWNNTASSFGGGTYDFTCVGYGTLKLPNNVVYNNALMVRVNLTEGGVFSYFAFFWYDADNGAILTEAIFGDGFFSPQAGYFISTLAAGTNDLELAADIKYNNPVQNNLMVNVKAKESLASMNYSLVNVMGEVVAAGIVPSNGTESMFTVGMGNLSAGIYFLNLKTNDGTKIAEPIKLVKM